ncbi:MAG: glycosyltransferase involved in cell wall biosynthesis [Polaribacter sp.]|jgi:glycosyltransferase involved in cell wall biosynthesis|tara:strand:+ start:1147 stop:1626 length:480 start_codon:yes stop_codon:yes gene_type:complete
MKLGIIIICYNIENDVDVAHCIKYLNEMEGIEICLVNNNSKDNTYDILKEVTESCENVSIVNIKQFKSDNSAVKAGARFMSNQFNLKHLGFINADTLSQYDVLSLLIKKIRDNHVDISMYNQTISNKKEVKQTMFQSLFPVMDYLAEINIENNYNELKA